MQTQLHSLLFYMFRYFTWCQHIMVNRLNYIHWLAKPSVARIRQYDPFFTGQTVNKLICWPFEQHFYRKKEQWSRGSSVIGLQNSGKLWFESKYLGKQSTILHSLTEVRGRTKTRSTSQICSTILHPLAKFRGQKICINKPKLLTVRASFLQEQWIRGKIA